MHLVGYFNSCITMHGLMNVKFIYYYYYYYYYYYGTTNFITRLYLFIAYYLSLVTGSMLDYGRFIPTCGNSSKYVLVLTHSMEHSPS